MLTKVHASCQTCILFLIACHAPAHLCALMLGSAAAAGALAPCASCACGSCSASGPASGGKPWNVLYCMPARSRTVTGSPQRSCARAPPVTVPLFLRPRQRCEQSASAELRACLHAPRPDQDGQHPAAALCDRNRHAPAALVLTKHLAQAAAPGCHVAAVRLARFHCAYDGQAATRAGTRARAWSSCRTALPAPSAPTSRS